ncbi:MAG: FxLD family lantipeptide [Streptosporangiales bacterium]|nr:FxLD family lantipeptide [Streptosporangiales bacterium]
MLMNELNVIENPFALDVQIVLDAVDASSAACTTNDGCAPSCASSCTSSSC